MKRYYIYKGRMWPITKEHSYQVIVTGDLLRFKNGNQYRVEHVVLSQDHDMEYLHLSWYGNDLVTVPIDDFERARFFTRMKYQRDLWRAEQGLY